MLDVQEVEIQCPFCAEPITILIDTSVAKQEYVEDCEVCCRPMVIKYQVQGGEVTELLIEREEH